MSAVTASCPLSLVGWMAGDTDFPAADSTGALSAMAISVFTSRAAVPAAVRPDGGRSTKATALGMAG